MTRIRFFENFVFCSDVVDAVLEDCRLSSIQLLGLLETKFELLVLVFRLVLLLLIFAFVLEHPLGPATLLGEPAIELP